MNKKIGKILLFIIISIMLELIVFNYGAIRTLINGNEKYVEYKLDVSTENNKYNYVLAIENLNDVVTSININYKENYEDIVKYETYFISEDDNSYKKISDKYMLANKDNTYILLDTRTKAKELKLIFQSEKQLNIDSILINHINLNFSIIRTLLIFAIINLIYYIKTRKIYEIEYNK